jgi:ParB-like chromosome segregation protein Spo0J
MIESIDLKRLVIDRRAYPRHSWDLDRIELFAGLMSDGEVMPPIEVVPRDDKYVIADGVHRTFAAQKSGRTAIEAVIVEPSTGESPSACAFRRALETACRSALPLTRAERRDAAIRLLRDRPDLSNRAVARLVGAAHSSVDRWIQEAADSAADSDAQTHPTRLPTADDAARSITKYLAKLDEARSLFDYLSPARMGRHLADAFEDRFGDGALTQAHTYARWLSKTADLLEERV